MILVYISINLVALAFFQGVGTLEMMQAASGRLRFAPGGAGRTGAPSPGYQPSRLALPCSTSG